MKDYMMNVKIPSKISPIFLRLLFIFSSSLLLVGCEDDGEGSKRSLLISNQNSDNVVKTDPQKELITEIQIENNTFLTDSEKPVKRYKSVDLYKKIISRTLEVNLQDFSINNLMRKSTGAISYLGTNGVNTNSRPIDSVSLGWFKTIRQYAGIGCFNLVNREANNISQDNVLIRSMEIPTESSLNKLVAKTLMLDDKIGDPHPIAKAYTPIVKQFSDENALNPGSQAYVNQMKEIYQLYCIAVLTDPLVIFY